MVSSKEGCVNHDQVLVLFETITLCPLTHAYDVKFTRQLVFDRVVIRTIAHGVVRGYMREGSNEASLSFPGQRATMKSCSESSQSIPDEKSHEVSLETEGFVKIKEDRLRYRCSIHSGSTASPLSSDMVVSQGSSYNTV